MTTITPTLGYTACSHLKSLLRLNAQNCIGLILVPGGYGFSDYSAPSEWTDATDTVRDPSEPCTGATELREMINSRRVGGNEHSSDDGMYLLFAIGVFSSTTTPTSIDFVFAHARLYELSGCLLSQAEKADIPVVTEIRHNFSSFAEERNLPKELSQWSPADYDSFAMYNFAHVGDNMYQRWLGKISNI